MSSVDYAYLQDEVQPLNQIITERRQRTLIISQPVTDSESTDIEKICIFEFVCPIVSDFLRSILYGKHGRQNKRSLRT
jgi:hypothetical protein